MKILKLESINSTNSWVAEHEKEIASPTLVYCHEQKAGRGQRGNSWESEPGKNITASIIFHPNRIQAIEQFAISEAVALSIVDFLRGYGVEAKVKWPNDIYYGDKKICGILVEHVVTGNKISRTIAGMGININQTVFLSDAPNPISLKMITGKEEDIEDGIKKLGDLLRKYIQVLDGGEEEKKRIHNRFLDSLWRKDGNFYRFYDRKKNEQMEARIESVEPTGILKLKMLSGEKRGYAFKEVEFLI